MHTHNEYSNESFAFAANEYSMCMEQHGMKPSRFFVYMIEPQRHKHFTCISS